MTDLFPFVLLIAGTFLVAGLVKGVVGLGLPTVAMGLLGLAMPPVEAAALLLKPSLVTNVRQLLAGPRFDRPLRRLWPMMLGVIAGTLAGSGMIAGTAAGPTTAALGVALVLYGVVGLAKPRLRVPAAAEPWAGPLVGVLPFAATSASFLALVPALAGMALGGSLRAWVRPETFRLCFFVGLVALGGELMLRGLA